MKYKLYKITNNITNDIYVGQTVWTLKKRFGQHVYRALVENNISLFYNAIKKYSKENFSIDLIEEVDDRYSANILEKKLISELKPRYNIQDGGVELSHHSEETKEKLSKVHCGKKLSDETKNKISVALSGIPKSEDHRKQMSLSARKHQTKETKEKLSNIFSKYWLIEYPNGNKDKIHNLNAFCKEHGLNYGNMHKVASGIKKSCKGFKVTYASN